jgi:hypothetical protein
MPLPNETSTNTATAPAEKPRRCRSLNTRGVQCRSTALPGHQLCFSHKNYAYPECPKKGAKVTLPLLADHDAIQLLLTQAAHGLFTGELDASASRALAYICHVAAQTLPRPLAVRPKEAEKVPSEPVTEVTTGPDGRPLGPEQDIAAPNQPEPFWSHDKWLYAERCERLGFPLPTCDADMPASGWLAPDEPREDVITHVFHYQKLTEELKEEKIRRDAEETAAALAAGLPDPHPQPRFKTACPYERSGAMAICASTNVRIAWVSATGTPTTPTIPSIPRSMSCLSMRSSTSTRSPIRTLP